MKIQWGLECYNIRGDMDKNKQFRTSCSVNRKNFLTFMHGMGKLNLATLTEEVMKHVGTIRKKDDDDDELPDKIMSDDD